MVTGSLLFWCCVCSSAVSLQPYNERHKGGHLQESNRRKQVIIRERLKFPSGFSTAVLISVLHGKSTQSKQELDEASKGGFASLVPHADNGTDEEETSAATDNHASQPAENTEDWESNLKLLIRCFIISGVCTIATYFVPILRNIPLFGTSLAQTWLWTLNPSLAYVGQGIIMGTETTLHMTLGAVVGWAILSPIAKVKGWAPGPVDDWETGSKGWIVWISLAIMLSDAVVSLSYIAFRQFCPKSLADRATQAIRTLKIKVHARLPHSTEGYQPVHTEDDSRYSIETDRGQTDFGSQEAEEDAPKHQLIGPRTVIMGLLASVTLCIGTVHVVFGDLVPLYATIVAVLMALVLSIMGVRALGETDLNPVSGISKLAQLFFAFIIPQSNKSSVLINLVAGAIVSSILICNHLKPLLTMYIEQSEAVSSSLYTTLKDSLTCK